MQKRTLVLKYAVLETRVIFMKDNNPKRPNYYPFPPILLLIAQGIPWPLFFVASMIIGVIAIGTLGTQALPNKERNLSIRNQKVLKY